jgi:hypothetical protein
VWFQSNLANLCIFFYWVSVWTDQGGRGHKFVSYACTKYKCNGLSYLFYYCYCY